MSSAPTATDRSRRKDARSPRSASASGTPGARPARFRAERLRRSELLQVSTSFKVLDDFEPQALGLTYWFDPPDTGGPFRVQVRFSGRRLNASGEARKRDAFDVVDTVSEVLPGSGPVAVTKRIADLTAGNWQVTASAQCADQSQPRRPAVKLPKATATGSTGYAPVVRVRAPGAVLGVWPALVVTGVVIALVLQFLLARNAALAAGRLLLVSTLGALVGLAGAKVYYAVEHRGRKQTGLLTTGMCIQGFVIGITATLLAGTAVAGLRVGAVLDVTAPGLLVAMGIGRIGCFFAGCCAGRPTRSRWGLWSSDRRLGLRRIPTQLVESAAAFTIGAVALLIAAAGTGDEGGALFVAALAAYVLVRQLLFPLRSLGRNTRHGRAVTMLLAGATLLGAGAAMLLG